LLVVHKIGCRFLLPAKFGDTLRIVTTIERATPARIDHSYKVYRADVLLAEGESTLACINRDGQVQRMPNMLYEDPLAASVNQESTP
jgi:acyl-CoA thioester hydrolase